MVVITKKLLSKNKELFKIKKLIKNKKKLIKKNKDKYSLNIKVLHKNFNKYIYSLSYG